MIDDFFNLVLVHFFKTVLAMSLTAAVAALVVMLARAVMKKLGAPRLIIFLLWAVVLFRMVCPTSFVSSTSVLGLLPDTSAEHVITGGTAGATFPTGQETGSQGGGPMVSGPAGDGVHPPAIADTAGTEQAAAIDWPAVLSLLWALGVIALCAWALVSYLRLKARVRAAVKAPDGAWESDRIDGPFVLGFFPPRVYLPLGLSGSTRDYVLLHERTHIRRGDHIVKAVAFLALAIHWFNPLLWVSWVLACRDMESVCDESVLRNTTEDIRQGYSAALLSLASVHHIRVPLAFGENDVKGRIKSVLKYKRPALMAVALAAVAVIIAGYALAADPVPLPGDPGKLTVTLTGEDTLSPAANITHWDGVETPIVPQWDTTPMGIEISIPVDLNFTGKAPDEVAVSTCVLTDGAPSAPQKMDVSQYAGRGGRFAFHLAPHPDSTGVGAEIRGVTVTARWESGVRYHESQYFFRLQLPSWGKDGSLSAPVVFAGGVPLGLYTDGFPDLNKVPLPIATVGSYAQIVQPSSIVAFDERFYLLNEDGSVLRRGQGSYSTSPGSASALGLTEENTGLVGLQLTYTYEDGSTRDYFCVFRCVERIETADISPEWDDKDFRIRFPGDADWTRLDALIPVPKSWAADSLAGRDKAKDMVGVLDSALGKIGFFTPTDGWLAFCLQTNLGPVDDTYFYRTSDGGHTWEEYSHFTARDISEDINWFGVSCADFSDEDHGYLGMGLFTDAPVFRTGDGGVTWELLDLPLPDGTWVCSDIWAGGSRLTFTDPEGTRTCTVYSVDGGTSWRSALPIDDPEQLPLDQLPWPSYLGTEQEFFPDINNWYYEPIKLLGLSADRTAAVFAFDEGMTGLSGLLLCQGGHLNYFPDLAWNGSPRMTSANPVWGDFDGDGVNELAVIPCVGTGTGVSMWDLYIFEPVGNGLVLGGSIRAYDDLQDLGPADLEGAGLPENARVGSSIYFWVEDGSLRSDIGIEDVNGIRSLSYLGTLECRVLYDGRSLTLSDFQYSENAS